MCRYKCTNKINYCTYTDSCLMPITGMYILQNISVLQCKFYLGICFCCCPISLDSSVCIIDKRSVCYKINSAKWILPSSQLVFLQRVSFYFGFFVVVRFSILLLCKTFWASRLLYMGIFYGIWPICKFLLILMLVNLEGLIHMYTLLNSNELLCFSTSTTKTY